MSSALSDPLPLRNGSSVIRLPHISGLTVWALFSGKHRIMLRALTPPPVLYFTPTTERVGIR
ncbi:hypothetical protein CVT26_008753 [Gymnopilus dilepis]|uniref:Uncharacterized protein n=1 Tax=Gymnopilus dilepis TaxID=231916 RepID=A0A409YG38_9AGAR|nr:hypothetical protein CVT26_008753 [Gymnopilus dilepis]